MKIKLVLITFILCLAYSLSAQDSESTTFSCDGSAVIYQNIYPTTENGLINFFQILFGLRAGVAGSLRYNLSEEMSSGIELGVQYISAESDSSSVNLFDVPLLGIFRYEIGSSLKAQAYAGPTFLFSASNDDLSVDVGLYAGAKIFLNNIFIDTGYVLTFDADTANYPRVGIGYALNDVFGF